MRTDCHLNLSLLYTVRVSNYSLLVSPIVSEAAKANKDMVTILSFVASKEWIKIGYILYNIIHISPKAQKKSWKKSKYIF